MRRIDQRTSAEYIPRSSRRLKAISNLSSVEAYECKRCWWLAHSLKVGKSTFCMNYTIRETHLQANSSERDFIRKPCKVSELPTELEALKESPELTVKLNCSLRETLRATGSVKFNSASDQHNSLMEEFSTSIASFWITISLLLIFVLISLILSFFIFIIIYAIIIAFLVINHL